MSDIKNLIFKCEGSNKKEMNDKRGWICKSKSRIKEILM